MKVKNIPRHTIIHIWKAYVKKLLLEHPKYYTKCKVGSAVTPFFVYTTIKNTEDKPIPFCVVDYSQFKTIIWDFLDRGKQEIMKGNSITIPGCGRIAPVRVERDFRSKRKIPNWSLTMASGKNPETGKYNKIYYYTNDDYCRIGWFKTSYITNITMYEFVPTNSGMYGPGFQEQFSKAITNDPFLKYRFIFSPLTNYILTPQEQQEIDSPQLTSNG